MPSTALRRPDELRSIRINRGFTRTSPGSVLFHAGGTTVLCTASVQDSVPPWMEGKGRGWITAEYNMLPHSTEPRKSRERGGRFVEIQGTGEEDTFGDDDLAALLKLARHGIAALTGIQREALGSNWPC